MADFTPYARNIAQIGGTAQTGRDWSGDLAKLDIGLTELAKRKRWGRNVEPSWIHGTEATAPAADTSLVSVTVGTGKLGYIYGFFITAQEGNNFKINWTSGAAAKSFRIIFTGAGTLQYVDFAALNEGLSADNGTVVSITNVSAGGTDMIYQARLLFVEV